MVITSQKYPCYENLYRNIGQTQPTLSHMSEVLGGELGESYPESGGGGGAIKGFYQDLWTFSLFKGWKIFHI
jgi:hypothetical protein